MPDAPDASAPNSIAAWLDELGLAEYVQAFAEHHIDMETLPHLTADDLRDLGIQSIGHRRKLLAAIAGGVSAGTPRANASTVDSPPAREPRASTPAGAEPAAAPASERRHVTTMFCDLVGFTPLAVSLDPETMHEILGAYKDACTAVIRRHDGHVVKFLGDGVLASFGYPRAHEDSGVRAVDAALEIVTTVGALRTPGGQPLAARVGIATGLVIVGDQVGEIAVEHDALVGEAPNLAARLQSAAEPGQVLVSGSTMSLLGTHFETLPLGDLPLKGFTEPVPSYRVLRRRSAATRFDAMHVATAAPVQGREGEIARLMQRYDLASSGRGQLVLISGDAGIGKSRLIVELYHLLGTPAHDRAMLQCSPHHNEMPFYPVRTLIEHGAAISAADPPELQLRKVTQWLREFVPVTAEASAIVAELLGIDAGDATALAGFGAREIRTRTMKTLVALLEAIAVARRVIVIEDIHWADPSTSELLGELASIIADLPVLIVATTRPRDVPFWLAVPTMTVLEVDRLHHEEVRRLAEKLAAPRTLTPAMLEAIVARSDGVPIFVEELTRAVVEAGAGDPDSNEDALAIPSTLAESLLARLDRLEHARETAQLAAVIGREFPEVLLLAVSTRDPADVQAGVRELKDAGVFQRRRGPFGETLAFRHMLLRDAAYGMMLRRDRARLHRHIADVLESEFPDMARASPHIVARHRTLAGDREQAIVLWQRAGNDAASRSASAEALAYFTKALALVRQLEPGHERDVLELELLLDSVGPMISKHGYGSTDVADEIDRAVVLSRGVNATHRIVPALYHKWLAVLGAGDHVAMGDIARDMTELASDGTVLDKLMAHRVMGSTLLFAGDPRGTLHETERFRALYDAKLHEAELGKVSATKTAVTVSLLTSEANWLLGDLDAAAVWREVALDTADEAGHYNTMCNVIAFLGGPLSVAGDPGEMAAHAAQLRRLSLGHDLPYWRPHADLLAGIADLRSSKEDAGFAQARRGITALVEQQVFLLGCWATFYAQACADFGRVDESLAMLAVAESRITAGEAWFAAENARLRARLGAISGDIRGALRDLEAAESIATAQGRAAFSAAVAADRAALAGKSPTR